MRLLVAQHSDGFGSGSPLPSRLPPHVYGTKFREARGAKFAAPPEHPGPAAGGLQLQGEQLGGAEESALRLASGVFRRSAPNWVKQGTRQERQTQRPPRKRAPEGAQRARASIGKLPTASRGWRTPANGGALRTPTPRGGAGPGAVRARAPARRPRGRALDRSGQRPESPGLPRGTPRRNKGYSARAGQWRRRVPQNYNTRVSVQQFPNLARRPQLHMRSVCLKQ